jgi:nucleotidyltransferase substrate binding protein (TIGR01987 family)
MEQASGYEKRRIRLNDALDTFEKSMAIDDSHLGDIERDTIKSGQAQKFEVCAELFWKTAKHFLYEIHGVEPISPKMTIKELFRTQYIDEPDYEKLIAMINDRNRLSHVYNKEQFNEIHQRLSDYLETMQLAMQAIG